MPDKWRRGDSVIVLLRPFPMRRATAFALLVLFSFLLVAPIFPATDEASLPPCCRRHGKHHHCMMMQMLAQLSSLGVTTVSERCPCKQTGLTAAHSAWSWTKPVARFYANLAGSPVRAAEMLARQQLSILLSRSRRGPPTLFA
jgi:hypothetical protein